jgi:hypothetical protein
MWTGVNRVQFVLSMCDQDGGQQASCGPVQSLPVLVCVQLLNRSLCEIYQRGSLLGCVKTCEDVYILVLRRMPEAWRLPHTCNKKSGWPGVINTCHAVTCLDADAVVLN